MPIPLPEVFQHTHAWTYGCPYVSPSLGSDSIVPRELMDPDVVYIRPPDKIHVFKTPGPMQYIPVPHMPPDPSDPTGMKQMMDFLGFKKEHIDIASSSVAASSASNTGSGSVGAVSATASGPSGLPAQQTSSVPSSTTTITPSLSGNPQSTNSANPNPGLIRYY